MCIRDRDKGYPRDGLTDEYPDEFSFHEKFEKIENTTAGVPGSGMGEVGGALLLHGCAGDELEAEKAALPHGEKMCIRDRYVYRERSYHNGQPGFPSASASRLYPFD